jgi:SET domain-containing protein
MILVDVEVKESPIHGKGLFSKSKIVKGSKLWEFAPPDFRIPLKSASEKDLHFGYINPDNPDFVVVCADHSKYWNFGLDGSNCGPSQKKHLGEYVIVALEDIKAGAELLISVNSDRDASRKLMSVH